MVVVLAGQFPACVYLKDALVFIRPLIYFLFYCTNMF